MMFTNSTQHCNCNSGTNEIHVCNHSNDFFQTESETLIYSYDKDFLKVPPDKVWLDICMEDCRDQHNYISKLKSKLKYSNNFSKTLFNRKSFRGLKTFQNIRAA